MGKKTLRKYGCPRFSESCADSSVRIRFKPNKKSEGRWSFLMALKIAETRPSPMDLDRDASFL